MNVKKKSLICITAVCLFCAGCAQSPSMDVMGSFFPAWMICLTIAVILTFVVRYLLVRYRLESEVGPLALFYPSVVLLFSALLWLILFR
jgi:heme/copper-type cytochrome/quinol oxidase subunit 2